jgi:hypothetical protein
MGAARLVSSLFLKLECCGFTGKGC